MRKLPDLVAGTLQEGETRRAVLACNDYLRLGPGRSLPKLARKYAANHRSTPPTRSLDTLKQWSMAYGWQARAAAYDSLLDEEIDAEIRAERRAEMREGLAQDFARVRRLKQLEATLIGELYDEQGDLKPEALWLPDAKQIGQGDQAERVDIVRFNAPLIGQLRGLLEDIAKETGGRISRSATQSLNIDFSQLTDEQVARIAAGEDPVVVLATSGASGAGTPPPG